MSRAPFIATLALLGACTQLQSARTLRRSQTRVSAGISRLSISAEGSRLPFYLGQLHVAHGITDTAEIGVQIGRSAGLDGTVSAVGIAPKISLHETPQIAVSLSVPALVAWEQAGMTFTAGAVAVYPTLYAGFQLDAEHELVVSPRVAGTWQPGSSDRPTVLLLGGSFGVSFGAPGRATLQPEIGLLFLGSSGSDQSETVLTLGFGVTAGD